MDKNTTDMVTIINYNGNLLQINDILAIILAIAFWLLIVKFVFK